MTPRPTKVAVFWDLEVRLGSVDFDVLAKLIHETQNCPVPVHTTGFDLVASIRGHTQKFGTIDTIKAYTGIREANTKAITVAAELQSSGVTIVTCPHNGQKDVVDNMIIVDSLIYALNSPDSVVILITGDRDYAYLVSSLSIRGHKVVVMAPSVQVNRSLFAQASEVIWWESVIGSHAALDRKHQLDQNPTRGVFHSPSSLDLPISDDISETQESKKRAAGSFTSGAAFQSQAPLGTSHSYFKPEPSSDLLPFANPNLPLQSTDPVRRSASCGGQTRIPSTLATPANKFTPLIEALKLYSSGGQLRPLRSQIAAYIKGRDGNVYTKAGCSGWTAYVSLASDAGVISLGSTGVSGREWISLPDTDLAILSTSGKIAMSELDQEQNLPAEMQVSPSLFNSGSNAESRTPGDRFKPLLECIRHYQKIGYPRPYSNKVEESLMKHYDSPLGGMTWSEYLENAEKLGLIWVGGQSGHPKKEWIALRESATPVSEIFSAANQGTNLASDP